MLRGIYTSASGMMANAHSQRIIGDNLSNVNTPGYRTQQAHLSPFAGAFLSRTGVGSSPGFPGSSTPMGSAAMGSRLSEISTSEAGGRLESTGRVTDLALAGPGYFAVDTGEEVRLTRAGNFTVDGEGYLATPAGDRLLGLEGPIRPGEEGFGVDGAGRVYRGDTLVDQIALVQPDEQESLERTERGLVRLLGRDPEAALAPVDPEGETEVLQGKLELSNVDLVEEMSRMMATFRSFGSNHSALQIQDESIEQALRIINNL